MIDQIICGDILDVIGTIPDNYVDLVVTSPPYYGLRSYNTEGRIWGGNIKCKHEWNETIPSIFNAKRDGLGPNNPFYDERAITKIKESADRTCGQYCQLCGAWKGELGLEPRPNLYVEHLVEICREIKRVIKPSGSFFLNLGDTYLNKQKLMIPARVAIALQDTGGWVLRNQICWSKPNNMPESVLDRFTETWESIFFFVKAKKYYFDLDAVRVPHSGATVKRYNFAVRKDETYGVNTSQKREIATWTVQGLQERPGRKSMAQEMDLDKGKNPGDVWIIPTNSYHGAHFATFPERLIEPIIRAACPPEGLVMDPFSGSGTTLLVARRLCRHFLGIDLNPEYVKMAGDRLAAVPVRIEQFFGAEPLYSGDS